MNDATNHGRRILALGLGLVPLLGLAAEPVAKIPYLTTPVQLDGVVGRTEWADAARLAVASLDGKKEAVPQDAEFYVKYDDHNLYVAAVCHETVPGFPQAFPRAWDDTLIFNDDAVELVIGVADTRRTTAEKIAVGGYVGGYGTATPADFYYQFVVNSLGARLRTFNETPLKQPLFQAKIARGREAWTAEMAIPLAAFGVESMTGRQFFANLVRFRPPDLIGWVYPRVGGYATMPFGIFEMLPPGRAGEKTVEDRRAAASGAAESATAKPAAAAEPASVARPALTLDYYPLSGAVVGQVSGVAGGGGVKAVLTVDGLPVATQEVGDARSRSHVLRFPVPVGGLDGRLAVMTLRSADGRALVSSRLKLKCPPLPEWATAKTAADYATTKVAPPWIRPVLGTDHSVRLLAKTLRFGANALFASVSGADGELLAAPMRIRVGTPQGEMVFSSKSLDVRQEDNRVRAKAVLTSTDGATILEVENLVDYDGFSVVKFRLLGERCPVVSSVQLEIPVLAARAAFLYRDIGQNVEALTPSGYSGEAGPLWVGDHDGGLGFGCDTRDVFLSTSRRNQLSVRAADSGDGMLLRATLVDGPGQLTAGQVFRVLLLPTPTKPVGQQLVMDLATWQWENWTEYMGFPDLGKISTLKVWSEENHKRGIRSLLYTCQGIAENEPTFKKWRREFINLPEWVFYKRAYEPGKNVDCYCTSKHGPEGELQLWAYSQLAAKAGIDGIVSDGMSLAWDDENPAHEGSVFVRAAWGVDEASSMVAQRQFLKRLRGVFADAGSDVYLAAHTGGAVDWNTLSFFEGYMEGETLCRYRPGYNLTPGKYFAYTGRPWGLRTIFWEKHWRRDRGLFWSYAYVLPHGNELSGDLNNPGVAADFERYRAMIGEFTTPDSVFHPYWRPAQPVVFKSGHSVMSYYTTPKAALVCVANYAYEDDAFTVDVAALFPGRPVVIRDLLTGQTVDAARLKTPFPLKGWQGAFLRVEPVASAAPAAAPERPVAATAPVAEFARTGRVATEWELGPDPQAATVDAHGGITLRSSPGRAATALFKPMFGRNATIRLKLSPTCRFSVAVGPVGILRDWNWQTIGPVNGWSEGVVYRDAPYAPKTADELVIGIKDGVMDLRYNGVPVVAGVAFNMAAQGNQLRIETWAGDTLRVEPEKLSTAPGVLFDRTPLHPVLALPTPGKIR